MASWIVLPPENLPFPSIGAGVPLRENYVFHIGRKLCISHRAKTLYFTSGKSSVFHIGRKRCISHRVKTLYFTSGGERAGDIQARFRVSELPPWRLDLAHDRVEGAHELLAVHLYRPVQFSI